MSGIDLPAARADSDIYRLTWERAATGHGSEAIALISAARAANRLGEVLTLAESYQRAYEQLAALHRPVKQDGPTSHCCSTCIAGYDPQAVKLLNAAWPCATWTALSGEVDPASLPEWERELLDRP